MKEFNTNTSGRQTLLRIFGTLVAFALLVYVLSQQGWPEIVAAFRLIAPWRLSLAMA
jgi:F0F1-type ATP synthase membrane subunit b/b'